MSFEEELKKYINQWDLHTVDKMLLYEDVLALYKQRVREAIEEVMADELMEEECYDCFPDNVEIAPREEGHYGCTKHRLLAELGL